NGLAMNRTWTFTTGTAPDTTAPTVTSTVPADTAVGVPVNTPISATFSEPMNAATLTAATFTLRGPGATPVSGIVSYDAPTRVATFTPTGPLAPSVTYT